MICGKEEVKFSLGQIGFEGRACSLEESLGAISIQVVMKIIHTCVQGDYSGQEEMRSIYSQERQVFKVWTQEEAHPKEDKKCTKK